MDLVSLFNTYLSVNTAFMIACICIAIAYFLLQRSGLPPGPMGLPFLGYAPFFGPNPQNTFLELGKKYGRIFSIYMGPKLTVVLNSYDAIKAAYIEQGETFLGRPDAFVFRLLQSGNDGKPHGVLQAEGDEWRTTRRFMLQTFRELGMGKSRIQDRILEEAEYLCSHFSANVGKAIDPAEPLTLSVANIMCILGFGRRFDHSDQEFRTMIHGVIRVSESLAQAGPLQAYPFLRHIPGKFKRLWNQFVGTVNRAGIVTRAVEDHKNTYEENETRDYIDAFFHQQKREQAKEAGNRSQWFEEDDLVTNLRTFLGVGTETTATTLLWVVLFMATYPEIQNRVQKEIESKIGTSRSITVEDRERLPTLESVIREAQRLGNVTPFGVLRTTMEDTVLMGYHIPKRTLIMPNFLAVNMDPSLWDHPEEFRPERFIDANGKVTEPAYFVPFSLGKRNCVGESLARMELFLFTSNLLQRFKFSSSPDSPLPPSTSCVTGISSRPLPYKVVISAR